MVWNTSEKNFQKVRCIPLKIFKWLFLNTSLVAVFSLLAYLPSKRLETSSWVVCAHNSTSSGSYKECCLSAKIFNLPSPFHKDGRAGWPSISLDSLGWVQPPFQSSPPQWDKLKHVASIYYPGQKNWDNHALWGTSRCSLEHARAYVWPAWLSQFFWPG